MRATDVSQVELGRRMGVTERRVSQILSGDQSLTLRTLARVGAALDASFDIRLVGHEAVSEAASDSGLADFAQGRPRSTRRPVRVVFDVNIFVMAVADRDPPFVPDRLHQRAPLNGNAGVVAIAIVLKGMEDGFFPCQLFVSPHILRMVIRVLKRKMGWPDDQIVEYLNFIRELAENSGGSDHFEPTTQITDYGEDSEDLGVLALALDAEADLLVTEDAGLLHLSPWRGKLPIIRTQDFGLRANDASGSSRPKALSAHSRQRAEGGLERRT